MHGNTLINVPKGPGDSMHDILRSKSAIWMQNTTKYYLGNPYQLKTNKKQTKTKQNKTKNKKTNKKNKQAKWLHSLRWRHNDHAGVSNHQPHGCLLNRLFRRKSKKTSKLRVTGLCAGNSPGTGEFPAQMASYAENVSIWWRHHVWKSYRTIQNGVYMKPNWSKSMPWLHVRSMIIIKICCLFSWIRKVIFRFCLYVRHDMSLPKSYWIVANNSHRFCYDSVRDVLFEPVIIVGVVVVVVVAIVVVSLFSNDVQSKIT